LGIGTVYPLNICSFAETVPRLALQRRTLRRKLCATAHALSPTSSTRCLNCITATRPSSAFLVLHLTAAPHLRPSRPLRPLSRRPRLQRPCLAAPRVKCRCARQRKHKARHSMTMKRRPRLPCWPLRASRAGFRDWGFTLRRDKWRTSSSKDRSTNSSLMAFTRTRIPLEYVSGHLYDILLTMAAASVQRVSRRVHSNHRR
jgi:hypothetical protein